MRILSTSIAIISFSVTFVAATAVAADATANDNRNTRVVTCKPIIDYSSALPELRANWYSVNDNVMGGRSSGNSIVNTTSLLFSGSINTNGGGFSSIRQPITPEQLAGADRLRISLKSDGRPYTISLRDATSEYYRLAHQARIPQHSEVEFETVDILFSELVPTFRGRQVNADRFNPAKASSIGIMLSEPIDGPFKLELAQISACRPST